MLSLEDFGKLIRKKNRIGIFLFISSFLITAFFFAYLNIRIQQIVLFFTTIIFYLILYKLLTKNLDKRFVNKYSDIVSYIFLLEYTGNKKYDIQRNFTKTEINNFIENLDCEEYAKFNKIPIKYYYVENKNYSILNFENEFLYFYTRKINWENINWKYAFVENDGIYEDLSMEYFDKEQNREIHDEVITNKIIQRPFHLFILFTLYDLKYGKKLSLYRNNYKKRFPFKFLGLSFQPM